MPPKEKPTGTFRTARLADDMKVEILLDFKDGEGDHTIRCYVDRATLEDATGQLPDDGPPLDGEDILDLFDIIKDRILAVVDRKLKLGQFEDDGSIVVWKQELTDRRKARR